MSPSIPALESRAAVKRYGPVVALDGVTLSVAVGEAVALVGESGSGKTTLLRCFNRMVEPDEGSILFQGSAAREMDPIHLRRQTGYVQQQGGLLPHWTVLRNAGMVPWLRNGSWDVPEAREALEMVGLPADEFGRRWPRELSGGQRQRVAIARALAGRPEVLLMDEPFGALDAITRAELRDSFDDLRRKLGITTVLVTHDLHEALLLADRVVVVRSGGVEQIADADTLLDAPATPYVARLLEQARLGGIGSGR